MQDNVQVNFACTQEELRVLLSSIKVNKKVLKDCLANSNTTTRLGFALAKEDLKEIELAEGLISKIINGTMQPC